MIEVTRLNGSPVVINAELIKFIEATPDTLISLTSGEKIMVKEPVELVATRAREYRHRVETESEGEAAPAVCGTGPAPAGCGTGPAPAGCGTGSALEVGEPEVRLER